VPRSEVGFGQRQHHAPLDQRLGVLHPGQLLPGRGLDEAAPESAQGVKVSGAKRLALLEVLDVWRERVALAKKGLVPHPATGQERGNAPHAHSQEPLLQRVQKRRSHPLVARLGVDRDAQHPGPLAGDAGDAGADHPAVAHGHDGGRPAAEGLDHLRHDEERRAARLGRRVPDAHGLVEVRRVEVPDVEGGHGRSCHALVGVSYRVRPE